MSAATERFNKVQMDYLTLVQGSLVRWDSALDDVRHRRASLSGLISDAIASWLDVATFSLSLLTNPPASAPPQATARGAQATLRSVSLAMKKNQPTASTSKVVDLSGDIQLKPKPLARTDATEGQIPAANVKVHLDDGGRVLVVQLVNMKKVPVGKYSGTVNDQNDASLASISVTVQ